MWERLKALGKVSIIAVLYKWFWSFTRDFKWPKWYCIVFYIRVLLEGYSWIATEKVIK